MLGEIAADMRRPQPMRRLLHGDVGSGKTIVAMQAALITFKRVTPNSVAGVIERANLSGPEMLRAQVGALRT